MYVKRFIGHLPTDLQPAALRIVVSYALVGGVWIIFSDRMLGLLVDDPASLARLQTGKGWFFVLLTACLLFLPINRSLQKLRRSEELALARLSEQELAETALAESELHYNSIMDASLAGIFVHRDLHFSYVNPTMAQLHGYSPDELTGLLGPTDLVIPEQRDWVTQNIARRELGESTRPFELKALRKDGSTFAALVWGKAISYEGRPASVGTLIDISEQRWAEGALRSAIDRLGDEKAKSEAVIEAIGDGISIQDTEFRIIYQNGIMKKWFGDRVGEFCYQVYEGRDQVCAGCPLEQSFADGSIHCAERLARAGSGVEIAELTTSALRDAAGKIIAGIEVVRDISARKRGEKALQASEKRFALFMENLPGVAFIRDMQGRYVYVNENWRKIYRKELVEEWFGKTVEELWPAATAAQMQGNDRRVLDGKEAVQTVETVIDEDGLHYWLSSKFPLLDDSGEPQFVGGIGIDITERKRAEEDLIELQRQQQAILDNIPDIVWLKDNESRFIIVNEAFAKACGVKAEDLVGKTDADIWPRDLAEQYRHDDMQVMLSGRRKCVEELLADPAGNRTWVETVKMPIYNMRGKIIGTTGIARDIHERKLAAEELLSYQKQLAALAAELALTEERERRRISSELHDQIGQNLAFTKIKLNGVMANLNSAGSLGALQEVQSLVNQIIGEVRSLTFQLSPPLLYEVGFEAAVEWLCERFQEEHGLQVECRDDRQQKPLSEEVRVTLFQLVRELLVNVVKHAGAKKVTITLAKTEESIRVKLLDDGRGFDPPKVVAERGKSGGFGLFNIRQRIGHFGGTCTVESAEGHGTRVTLVAPLAERKKGGGDGHQGLAGRRS